MGIGVGSALLGVAEETASCRVGGATVGALEGLHGQVLVVEVSLQVLGARERLPAPGKLAAELPQAQVLLLPVLPQSVLRGEHQATQTAAEGQTVLFSLVTPASPHGEEGHVTLLALDPRKGEVPLRSASRGGLKKPRSGATGREGSRQLREFSFPCWNGLLDVGL